MWLFNFYTFVPTLATNRFAANQFAKDYQNTLSETLEYPSHKWINRGTGAVEFAATIQQSNLAYLKDRTQARVSKPIGHRTPYTTEPYAIPSRPTTDTLEIPCWVIKLYHQCLQVRTASMGSSSERPIRSAVCAEKPLLSVYSDVHGPVPVRSRNGHYYWITFIDNHLRHPAVYYLMCKSDAFAAFMDTRRGLRISRGIPTRSGRHCKGDVVATVASLRSMWTHHEQVPCAPYCLIEDINEEGWKTRMIKIHGILPDRRHSLGLTPVPGNL